MLEHFLYFSDWLRVERAGLWEAPSRAEDAKASVLPAPVGLAQKGKGRDRGQYYEEMNDNEHGADR